ncbi:MAG TPA: hypothetical protein VK783_07920 [Bacteroidia bacterium]|jgi:hypothetical protein|nr:hypothetical protein [Bacteroidia bacterium]
MKRYFGILAVFYSSLLNAQSVYAPLNDDYYHLIDRMDIKAENSGNIFTSVKPYLRNDIAGLTDKLAVDTTLRWSKVDKANFQYLQDDNWEWSNSKDSGNSSRRFIWGLYKKKNAFYEINKKDIMLQLNPVAYFTYGKDRYTESPALPVTKSVYLNTRGIEIRGDIDGKVGFYTLLTDNQAVFPEYVNNVVKSTYALPGEGYYKPFKLTGYDFYDANGYIDFNFTKHISTQFGQDKNFIGDGYRSLMLSDYSSNYLFWKVDTKIWKFEYVNVFAEMVADNLNDYTADANYPRKYMALHYLSYHVTKNFDIGLFESITFGNTDTIHNRGYDLNYLNPIIFYNAVENGLGAPDKDHVGFNFKWNFLHHFSLYGTVLLDEFDLPEVLAHTGWWGNKQAFQVGAKYIDLFGIKNLDGQLEFNMVPPYTYTHFSFSSVTDYSYFANYSNYNQPLADPNGANFYEGIGILRFQPIPKLTLTGKLFVTVIGLDTAGLDYGSNVMIDYDKRVSDYGNFIGQGAKTTIVYVSGTVTFQLAHNMFIDLTAIIRNESSIYKAYNNSDDVISASFRWNIAKRLQEF